MIRSRLVAASALALTMAPLAVATQAGATAPPKPVITSVVVNNTNPNLSSSQIGYAQTATVTVTGSGFNHGTYNQSNVSFGNIPNTANGSGVPTGGVMSVVRNPDGTQLTISLSAPSGLLKDTTKPIKAETISVNVPVVTSNVLSTGGKVSYAGPAVVSNCGSSTPLAAAGSTYGTTSSGSVDVNSGATGADPTVDYFDVHAFGELLCANDLGMAGAPNWAINYPLSFVGTGQNLTSNKKSANYGHGQMRNVGFSFPYTSDLTLSVYGTTVTYKLSPGTTATACAADTNNPSGTTVDSCTVSSKGIVTIQSSATVSYVAGDTISSPVVKITGVSAKGTSLTMTPVSVVSYISLGAACTPGPTGNCLSITFAPRAKTANATFAPIQAAVSAS